MISHYKQFLSSIKEKKLYRTLQVLPDLINFSHNDYLGLSQHPDVINASLDYTRRYGTGSKSSRLISGTLDIHLELEQKIAKMKSQEAALTFPSGFQANVGVLKALLDKNVLGCEPLVFADRLNHSSMHMGCQLAGARQIRYSHLDMTHLEELLQKHQDDNRAKFILTESVFGMDGDYIDMARLVELAHRYSCFLYVDEAHTTGLFGEGGSGLSSGYDFDGLVMGTFSKALGSIGGFVASSSEIIDFLVNYCTSFIYSTALPPMIVGAVSTAIDLLPHLDAERTRLFDLARLVRRELALPPLESHIIAIPMRDEAETMRIKSLLAEKGILVGGIRPPTVPTCRLRIAINSTITQENVEYLLKLLKSNLT